MNMFRSFSRCWIQMCIFRVVSLGSYFSNQTFFRNIAGKGHLIWTWKSIRLFKKALSKSSLIPRAQHWTLTTRLSRLLKLSRLSRLARLNETKRQILERLETITKRIYIYPKFQRFRWKKFYFENIVGIRWFRCSKWGRCSWRIPRNSQKNAEIWSRGCGKCGRRRSTKNRRTTSWKRNDRKNVSSCLFLQLFGAKLTRIENSIFDELCFLLWFPTHSRTY